MQLIVIIWLTTGKRRQARTMTSTNEKTDIGLFQVLRSVKVKNLDGVYLCSNNLARIDGLQRRFGTTMEREPTVVNTIGTSSKICPATDSVP